MAAVILTLVLSLLLAAAGLLIGGSRLHLSQDSERNDRLNFAAYYLAALPLSFVLIFFGVGG